MALRSDLQPLEVHVRGDAEARRRMEVEGKVELRPLLGLDLDVGRTAALPLPWRCLPARGSRLYIR